MSGLRFVDPARAEHTRSDLFRAGIIAETAGDGHVLKFLPPLTMTPGQWREIAGRIGDVVLGLRVAA